MAAQISPIKCLLSKIKIRKWCRISGFSLHQLSSQLSTGIELDRDEIRIERSRLFDKEKKRQQDLIARLEKIEITVKNAIPEPNDVVLIMNKDVSTPFMCAKHIHELVVKRSVVALVDGQLYDMHRPLTKDCTIEFLHFKQPNPYDVNKVYWRSCSFLMGMIIDSAFKNQVEVIMHSWPQPNPKSGCFVYDAVVPALEKWVPTEAELRALSIMTWKIKEKNLPFERLDVSPTVAKEIFADNKFKSQQINGIAEKNEDNKISLYRVGEHIDMSVGPMVANTSVFGRTTIASVHSIDGKSGNIYRFQGVSIPSQLRLNYYAFRILTQRAKKPNMSNIPVI